MQQMSNLQDETTRDRENLMSMTQSQGVIDEDVERQCDRLFHNAPIPFVPNKAKRLDIELASQINKHQITIPVVFIEGYQYLIGPHIFTCKLRGNDAMVKIGEMLLKFEEFVPQNHREFERTLVNIMCARQCSLEAVVQDLAKVKKLSYD